MSQLADDVVAGVFKALGQKAVEDGKGRFDELMFAEKLMRGLPPIRVIGDEWYAYENGAWLPVTRAEFLPRAAAAIPKRYRKARHAQNLLDHIEVVRQAKREELIGFYKLETDADGNQDVLLNVANGVLRVDHAGEKRLERHDEGHGFTARAAAKWDEKAECPLFCRVVGESMPDALDAQLLQVFMGNVLFPTAQFETALVCFGPGGTSKSTVAEALFWALAGGRNAGKLVTSLSMAAICDSRSYSLPNLRYAAMNLGTEIDTIKMDESSHFKVMISGEEFEARQIYGHPESMRTTAKMFFLTNGIPRFKNGTEAELRRLRFLNFNVAPAVKDTGLKARLRLEQDGIFRWMVEGLVMLMARGAVPQGGEKSEIVVRNFAVNNDPVGYFVKEYCVIDREASVLKDRMLEHFDEFLAEHGLPTDFKDWFFRRLYERFTTVKGVRQRAGLAEVIHRVSGIRLKTQDELLPA